MSNLKISIKKEGFDLTRFFARLSFKKVFALWIISAILFSLIFYLSSFFKGSGVVHWNVVSGKSPLDFLDILYFSFITLTSTGYGDFAPIGLAKIAAVVEIIIGLILFGVFISKFVSRKQELILEEIYKISIEERLGRLRLGLSLFKANVARVIERMKNNAINDKEVNDFSIMTNTFVGNVEDVLQFMIQTEKKKEFVHSLDIFSLETLISSIDGCFARMLELFKIFKKNKIKWKNDENLVKNLKKTILLTRTITHKCDNKEMNNEVSILIKEINRKINEIEKQLS